MVELASRIREAFKGLGLLITPWIMCFRDVLHATHTLPTILAALLVLRRTLEVINTALVVGKWPLEFVVVLVVVAVTCDASIQYGTNVAQRGVQLVCGVAVSSWLPFCPSSPLFIPSRTGGNADFPSLMRIQNVALDELMSVTTRGKDLALDLKHAELAVRDLIVDVRLSNLTIKDPLAGALSGFVQEARVVGRGLQQLSSKVNGVFDG